MPADTPVGQRASPPEPHAISPALRRRLQQCYEHGTRLAQQEACDHDYAHSILVECVVNDPGNLVYVEAMLQNLQKKYRNNKRGAWLGGFGGRGPLKKAAAKKDWNDVLRLGPAVLKKNPWDVATLRALADACAAYGYHEVELRYLKSALDANPKDPAVNRHCALSLARIGQFDQAIVCWERVDEIRRGDVEAQQMISELQIEKTRQRGRFGGEPRRTGGPASAPAPVADEPPPPAAEEPPRRQVRLTPRQELEQQIANHPTDLTAYFELAQLHLNEGRDAEALHVLHKALGASGNSHQVQERIEDVEIIRKQHQLAVAEKQAAHNPTEETKHLVEQLRSDLQRFEWEVFYRRAERYPQDPEIQFQLGLRLKRLEKPREALSCFEAARKAAARRAEAELEMGECWQLLKQYGKALECYRRAAQHATIEQAEIHKRSLYRAAVLATALQNLDTAESCFVELLQLDPTYKDVATRLDKVREIRHKG